MVSEEIRRQFPHLPTEFLEFVERERWNLHKAHQGYIPHPYEVVDDVYTHLQQDHEINLQPTVVSEDIAHSLHMEWHKKNGQEHEGLRL